MAVRQKNFTSLGIDGDLIPDLSCSIDGDVISVNSSYAWDGCLNEAELKRTGGLLSGNYEDCEHLINEGKLRLGDIACSDGCFLPKYLRRPGE